MISTGAHPGNEVREAEQDRSDDAEREDHAGRGPYHLEAQHDPWPPAPAPGRAACPYRPEDRGRRDQYVDAYASREYEGLEAPALEVITRGYQMLFYPLSGQEYLGEMARDDPEMLDLLLGMLFHYTP